MLRDKLGNALTVVLVMVIVLILGLLGWFIYDTYKQNSINNQAKTAIEEFEENIKKRNKNIDGDTNSVNSGDRITSTSSGEKTYLAGCELLGVLEIPKTKIEYPILSKVTKQSLETAVAMLYGPGLNKVGNTVILGHNYRKTGMFFSDNYKLTKGDKVFIKDQSGEKVTYEIYNTYQTEPNDAEYMKRDTEGAREISLSTCNDDSSQRLIIWAKEKVSSNQTENDNEDEESDENKNTSKNTVRRNSTKNKSSDDEEEE